MYNRISRFSRIVLLSNRYILCKKINKTVNKHFSIEQNVCSIVWTNRLKPGRCTYTVDHSLKDINIKPISKIIFEKNCEETLQSLCEYFEELIERVSHLKHADVNYSDGILTLNFGKPYGTYVINRQSPNHQIWLSSPTSGPKRYDFVQTDDIEQGYWIYKHDGVTLHRLLQNEIGLICKIDIDLSNCAFSQL